LLFKTSKRDKRVWFRDGHGAGAQESTPAGVCIFRRSRSRSVKFKIEPELEPELESVLRSI